MQQCRTRFWKMVWLNSSHDRAPFALRPVRSLGALPLLPLQKLNGRPLGATGFLHRGIKLTGQRFNNTRAEAGVWPLSTNFCRPRAMVVHPNYRRAGLQRISPQWKRSLDSQRK